MSDVPPQTPPVSPGSDLPKLDGSAPDGGPRGSASSAAATGGTCLVIGGGLTGLTAAYRLARAGRRVRLMESAGEPGGKARSRRAEGYTFDITGHWLHLRDPRAKALLAELCDPEAWCSIARRTEVLLHGRRLAFPFQANLHGLAPELVARCLDDFVQAQIQAEGAMSLPAARSFREFVERRFGRAMCELFFLPYNRKLWGPALDQLSADCMHRFLPLPERAQIIAGALGVRQTGLGYNARFRYPKAGGIDRLPRDLARACEAAPNCTLELQSEVEGIDLRARRVTVAGRSYGFSQLISTMPLPQLIDRIVDVPSEIREARSALQWVSWRYLDVATHRPVATDCHWAYVPEVKYPFFRVGVYSNALPAMAPEGCSSLYVELNDRVGSVDEAAVAAGLVELGVLTAREDIRFMHRRDIEVAYVVQNEAHAGATARIHAWLADQGVRSCGRYGHWKYSSMEDALLDGLDAADWAGAQTMPVEPPNDPR